MNLFQTPHRFRLLVFTFVGGVIFLAACLHAFRKPRLYRAVGIVEFVGEAREGNAIGRSSGVEEWQALVAVEREKITHFMAKRLTLEDRGRLLAPYGRRGNENDADMAERLINENQRLSVRGLAGTTLFIEYSHPDRHWAARVVNLLIDERVAYSERRRIDGFMHGVEELKARVEFQEKTVRNLSSEMQAYREARIGGAGVPFESDAHYGELERKREEARQLMHTLITRMRDLTMISGPVTQSWRVRERAVPPNEDDYLYASIARDVALGLAIPAAVGLVAMAGTKGWVWRQSLRERRSKRGVVSRVNAP